MMSHPDDFCDPDDSHELSAALAPLQTIVTPLEAQVANRLAVAKALAEILARTGERRLPWWRRSVSVPAPLAAAAMVMLAAWLALEFGFWQFIRRQPPAAPAGRHLASNQRASNEAAPAAAVRRRARQPYQSETYLCGIGQVHSEAHYFASE